MSHEHPLAPETCPSCAFGSFERNAYWMGKLMLPRDFIDEQRFFLDKLRHHHVYLHGWGVVCGLQVVPHEVPACQARFVCVAPGVAVDCCGHDLILTERDCIDLLAVPAIKALQEAGDTAEHLLQVCIRYRECPTEQVPVLYDDCGCESERCAPNRILESIELAVLVDPDIETEPAPPADCGDIWAMRAAHCTLCDMANCVVLATIAHYVAGQPVDNTAVTIDNASHRKLLPSNQTIKEVIDCLLAGGGGGGGGPGLDGATLTMVDCSQPGSAQIVVDAGGHRILELDIPNGCPPGIDNVTLTMVDCAQPASAAIDTEADGTRVLKLVIPSACGQEVPPGIDDISLTLVDCSQPGSAEIVMQADGTRTIELVIPTGCGEKLNHICGISWKHNGGMAFPEVRERGLFIVFDALVEAADLNPNVVIVEARNEQTGCWCEVRTELVPGDFPEPCVIDIPKFQPSGAAQVTALQIRPALNDATPRMRVLVKGDFLRDAAGKGMDLDHLPPWFGNAAGYRTGDGVEGGTFESWFRVG